MRLFVLLESACHELDMTAQIQGTEDFGPSYRRYSAALQKLTELKDEQLSLKSGLQLLKQLLTRRLVTGVLIASNPVLLLAM